MNSCYANKSDLFIGAAEEINNSTYFYLAVPHSAYYSCFLWMKHLCYSKYGKTENEIKNEVDPTMHGTHEIMAEFIRMRLYDSACKFEEKQRAKEFIAKIGQLKRIRFKADYGEESITITQSMKSIELAKDVLKILKTI